MAQIDLTQISSANAAYTPFTVSWQATSTNPNIGNGSIVGKYLQIGKSVTVNIFITAGSTTSFGSGEWWFVPPVTPKDLNEAGSWWGIRSGVSYYCGTTQISSTTALRCYTNGAGSAVSNSSPTAWGNGDQFKISITYEAA